jgi:hypothetical protein
MNGKMLWFNSEKGYGYIQTENDERLYVASAGFLPKEEPRGRRAGPAGTLERTDEADEPRAVDVAFVPESELPNRARLRTPRSGSKL